MRDRDEEPGRAAVLLLSTADWDAPLWTNKQHMARELARSNDVTYVESLGLRRPRLDLADARRIVRRLRPRRPDRAGARPVPPAVRLVRPLVLPLHTGPTRPLQRRLVRRATAGWSSTVGPRVLWTYSPLTYGLEERTAHRVYHAVDLLGAYPGIPEAAVDAAERHLATLGTTAIASSPPVRAHLLEQGFEQVVDWPNVGEVEPFATRAGGRDRHPHRVVFGGNLTPYKVDLELVETLARSHPELDVVLAGPLDEGGAGRWSAATRLTEHGVRLTGPLPVPALVELYTSAAVGIIPYRRTPYTRGVDPLKLFEYLAAGLPVVATDLPGIRAAGDGLGPGDLVLAGDDAAFVAAVAERARCPAPADIDRRVAVARDHSWERRGDEARRLVRELVSGGSVAACPSP
jgi:glycosyltransferase involved in cell wall biosynthesis